MSLNSGTRLGPYEVIGSLGAGGMGEVYRARDTKLNREVALKVLPDVFAVVTGRPAGDYSPASSDERLARLEREAQLLASLNHPNIAAIYGIEDGELPNRGPLRALVLELVEGPTLADRIARGPIPLDEALPIARQIADALAAAHERGIIHRDLKPANIKLRADGTVKVLDFGLAKALEPVVGAGDVSQSPTITSPAMTRAGIVMGTAAYMSPEQARGQPAGERSDIWAFGCVLFEMLTATRAFPGDTIPETLAAVLRSEPDWSCLPAGTPDGIRRMLRRSLQRDRAHRLADIRDARLDIDDDGGAPPSAGKMPSLRRERVLWVSALAIGVAVALAVSWDNRDVPAATPERKVELVVPPTTDPASFAISPNGQYVVFVASTDGRPKLWLRSLLPSGDVRPLTGSDGASDPFWSPDNRSIGFFTRERLYRIELDGGAPRPLAVAAVSAGGTWNRNGEILFPPVPDAAIQRVDAETGKVITLPGAEQPLRAGQRFPQFLPDGRHFVYYEVEFRAVMLAATDSSERRLLYEADAPAVVAPPDKMLYVLDGQLFAQTFDPVTFKLTGERRKLGENVAIDSQGGAALSASSEGSVLYRTGSGNQARRLVLVDRSGTELRALGSPDPGFPMNPDLSPDGARAVLNRTSAGNTGIQELDLNRGLTRTLTRGPAPEIEPVFSCNGDTIVFATVGSQGIGGMYRMPAAGGEPTLIGRGNATQRGLPIDVSCTGTVLYRIRGERTGWDIRAVQLDGKEPDRAIQETEAEERIAQFSPDGKWIAYESNEDTGVFDIYVQPFPDGRGKKRVSRGGGVQVRWEGKEIIYVSADGYLTAVSAVTTADGKDIVLGPANRLFPARVESMVEGGIMHMYAVTKGGQQFLMSTFTELPSQALTLILDLARGQR